MRRKEVRGEEEDIATVLTCIGKKMGNQLIMPSECVFGWIPT